MGFFLLVFNSLWGLLLFLSNIQMSGQNGPLDWNFTILDLEWCLVYVYGRLWYQIVIFFPSEWKGNDIVNSDQSHKSGRLHKHGPLDKPEVGSGA
jgi:hypothetical protein